MLTAIVVILFLVGTGAAIANGEWGPAAVGIVIILLALGLSSASTRDSKAYIARQEYWAKRFDAEYGRKRRR